MRISRALTGGLPDCIHVCLTIENDGLQEALHGCILLAMRAPSFHDAPTRMAHKMGGQVRSWRIQQGLRQSDLAQRSGVGEIALRRLETGGGVTLSTLLQVLEALGKLSRMEALLDPVRVSPMDALSRNLVVPGKPSRASSSRGRARKSRGEDKGSKRGSVEKTPARPGSGEAS